MRVKLRRLISIVSLGLLTSFSVLGAPSVVTQKNGGCEYFVTKVGTKYAVLELNAGPEPKKGDQLKGEFGEGHMGHLQNVRTGEKIKVWFENYPVSKEEALRLYTGYVKTSCRS